MSAPSLRLPPGGGASLAALLRGSLAADGPLLLAIHTVSLLLLTATIVTRYWSDHLWFGWVLVGLTTLIWLPELTRPRARRWWFLYVVGIFTYTLLRSYADDTAIPTRFEYVIEFDRALVFWAGVDPVVWLQRQFFEPGRVTWFDVSAVVVHWSFFFAPHAAALIIFWRQRRLFPRFALFIVAIMYAGLVLFFLVPTAPPWLSASVGELPGAYRVMHFVGGEVAPETYEEFYASLGEPNSVAAMPSIHMAATFALYLWARVHARRIALPLLGYSLLMGFALVYLAEHYVADLLVGAAIAIACWLVARRLPEAPRLDGR